MVFLLQTIKDLDTHLILIAAINRPFLAHNGRAAPLLHRNCKSAPQRVQITLSTEGVSVITQHCSLWLGFKTIADKTRSPSELQRPTYTPTIEGRRSRRSRPHLSSSSSSSGVCLVLFYVSFTSTGIANFPRTRFGFFRIFSPRLLLLRTN